MQPWRNCFLKMIWCFFKCPADVTCWTDNLLEWSALCYPLYRDGLFKHPSAIHSSCLHVGCQWSVCMSSHFSLWQRFSRGTPFTMCLWIYLFVSIMWAVIYYMLAWDHQLFHLAQPSAWAVIDSNVFPPWAGWTGPEALELWSVLSHNLTYQYPKKSHWCIRVENFSGSLWNYFLWPSKMPPNNLFNKLFDQKLQKPYLINTIWPALIILFKPFLKPRSQSASTFKSCTLVGH